MLFQILNICSCFHDVTISNLALLATTVMQCRHSMRDQLLQNSVLGESMVAVTAEHSLSTEKY